MIKIGITGSLASGKSTVAKLISRGRYPIFNADKTVADLYKKKDFVKKIKKKFNIINSKNIRKKIKTLIQKDKKKLKKLELIVHPLVRKEMLSLMRLKKKKTLIFDIPLLIESKLMKYFDIIVFVGAKRKVRLKRYLHKKGNRKIFTILDKRQITPSKKIKISDHVIYNNSSIKVLKKKVRLLMNKL
jgi:dephospho-CoA kinase